MIGCVSMTVQKSEDVADIMFERSPVRFGCGSAPSITSFTATAAPKSDVAAHEISILGRGGKEYEQLVRGGIGFELINSYRVQLPKPF